MTRTVPDLDGGSFETPDLPPIPATEEEKPMIDDGGSAFPILENEFHNVPLGMSLRDYFAAAALRGLLAYSHVGPYGNYHENCTVEGACSAAYQYADAMIRLGAKEDNPESPIAKANG